MELKSCDARSMSGESSKLSEGIVYFIICLTNCDIIKHCLESETLGNLLHYVPAGTVD